MKTKRVTGRRILAFVLAILFALTQPAMVMKTEAAAASIFPEYKTLQLSYSGRANSGAINYTSQGLQSMIKNKKKNATYTAVISNKKVAKTVANKWSYYKDKTLIVSTGLGTTTATMYEQVGKAKKKKIGAIKIKVTRAPMEDICGWSYQNHTNYLSQVWLKLNLREDLKSKDLGQQMISEVLAPSDKSVTFKPSDYKMTWAFADYSEEEGASKAETDHCITLTPDGQIRAVKAGEDTITVTVDFADKSSYFLNGYVKVTDSILKKEGKYNINNIRSTVVGLDTPVELKDGRKQAMINFDNAATTPALQPVADEVNKKMEMYASIHRGSSQKSNYSTEIYNETRDKVIEFLGADPETYTCFYVNSTTDGLNKLASALVENKNDLILTTRIEHHANDLTWRNRCKVIYAEVDSKGRVIYSEIEKKLKENKGKVKYVSVTAASNVTGYVTDVHRVAKLAHKYGAKIIVDGAQIVAHRKFSMLGATPEEDIDFIAFSAHKMYSPYGGGAVVGLSSVLNKHMPTFYGGGTIKVVGDDWAIYQQAPEVYEAGSPNYPGVVGLGKAIDILNDVGFESIQAHEKALNRKLMDGLAKLDNVILYGDTVNIDDRVGVVTFNFTHRNSLFVADAMSDIGGVATRRGAFCAHPYVWRLMGISDAEAKGFEQCTDAKSAGMIRVSFGIYNTEKEIDEMLKIMPKALDAAGERQLVEDHIPEY